MRWVLFFILVFFLAAPAGAQRPQQAQRSQTSPASAQEVVPEPVGERPARIEEPLVRPFGEPQQSLAPIIEFGQRAPVPVVRVVRDTVPAAAVFGPYQVIPRMSLPYDHIPSTLLTNRNFAWFFEFDTNKDGQLSMSEWVTAQGGAWTENMVKEFQFLDRNRDGFITIEEALRSIEEYGEINPGAAIQPRTTPAVQPARQPAARPAQGRRAT